MVTASSVITDESRNYKMSVFSYEILPKYAILDPELIMTAPASIAALNISTEDVTNALKQIKTKTGLDVNDTEDSFKLNFIMIAKRSS